MQAVGALVPVITTDAWCVRTRHEHRDATAIVVNTPVHSANLPISALDSPTARCDVLNRRTCYRSTDEPPRSLYGTVVVLEFGRESHQRCPSDRLEAGGHAGLVRPYFSMR